MRNITLRISMGASCFAKGTKCLGNAGTCKNQRNR